MRMFQTNFWWPSVEVQQNTFERDLIQICSPIYGASSSSFWIQIGQFVRFGCSVGQNEFVLVSLILDVQSQQFTEGLTSFPNFISVQDGYRHLGHLRERRCFSKFLLSLCRHFQLIWSRKNISQGRHKKRLDLKMSLNFNFIGCNVYMGKNMKAVLQDIRKSKHGSWFICGEKSNDADWRGKFWYWRFSSVPC